VSLAQEEIKRFPVESTGSVHFHELDLSSISSARKSAQLFKKVGSGEGGTGNGGGRLDIIIGNAGIAFPSRDVLSEDGIERTFAVNCLGHYVLVTELLGTSLSSAPPPSISSIFWGPEREKCRHF